MVRRHANTDTRFSIDNQPLLPRAVQASRSAWGTRARWSRSQACAPPRESPPPAGTAGPGAHPSRLHPRREDRPHDAGSLDLRPRRQSHLTGSRRRQHQKLERKPIFRCNGRRRPHRLYGRGHVLVGQHHGTRCRTTFAMTGFACQLKLTTASTSAPVTSEIATAVTGPRWYHPTFGTLEDHRPAHPCCNDASSISGAHAPFGPREARSAMGRTQNCRWSTSSDH